MVSTVAYILSTKIPSLHHNRFLQHEQHSGQYSMLSCMVQDYLAIQGTAVPLEQAFSSGALTGTQCCNHFTLQMFEALQILKSTYWNGHIGAAEEAAAHVIAFLGVLELDSSDEDFLIFSNIAMCHFLQKKKIFSCQFWGSERSELWTRPAEWVQHESSLRFKTKGELDPWSGFRSQYI